MDQYEEKERENEEPNRFIDGETKDRIFDLFDKMSFHQAEFTISELRLFLDKKRAEFVSGEKERIEHEVKVIKEISELKF